MRTRGHGRRLDIQNSCMALLRQFSCSGKRIEAIDFDEYFNKLDCFGASRDVCPLTFLPLHIEEWSRYGGSFLFYMYEPCVTRVSSVLRPLT